jgi:glucan 1,3-beta-glucosidase
MDGWGNLKDSDVAVTFHDAFQGVTSWNDWGAGMWNLLLDTHHYEIFDNGQVSQDLAGHLSMACDFGNQMASTGKPTISGEWTGAITDCAKWLNGKDKGARYDGTLSGSSKVGDCTGKSTGSIASLSSDDKNNIGRFIEAQLDAYEKAAGWIFWTWKTEGAPEWDMQDLLANGIFPQPLTSRKCTHSPREHASMNPTDLNRSWPVWLNIALLARYSFPTLSDKTRITFARPNHRTYASRLAHSNDVTNLLRLEDTPMRFAR